MASPSSVSSTTAAITTTTANADEQLSSPQAPSIMLHTPKDESNSYSSNPQIQTRTTTTTLPPSTTTNIAPRRSANLHQTLLTKLRPLPFQYIYTFSHQKSSKSSGPESLTILAPSIPDIAAFYRAHNNFPFNSLTLKDSVHIFRSGVQPLWEDAENVDGGCWTLKARREDGRALRVFEEIAIMVVGGELQAAVQVERDHVLGVSYSPRLYWAHVSVWTKKGGNEQSVKLLEETILSRLSEELRPRSEAEYYYKKHRDHEGWEEVVKGNRDG